MASTAAHIRANAKYNKKAYKQLAVHVKPDFYNKIDTHCKNNNISKTQLITQAVNHWIDNDIVLTDTQQDSTTKTDSNSD